MTWDLLADIEAIIDAGGRERFLELGPLLPPKMEDYFEAEPRGRLVQFPFHRPPLLSKEEIEEVYRDSPAEIRNSQPEVIPLDPFSVTDERRVQLHHDLKEVKARYDVKMRSCRSASAREYEVHARAIQNAAQKLLAIIDAGPHRGSRPMGHVHTTVATRRGIEKLARSMQNLRDPEMHDGKSFFRFVAEHHRKTRDEIARWLLGAVLPAVYQRHFGRRAGVSRPSGGGIPGGPYIRFVEEVCNRYELHQPSAGGRRQASPFSPETIAKYLRRMPRRRNRATAA